MQSLESYNDKIIGHDTSIFTPYGTFPLVYADWAASGRLYEPIEQKMKTFFGPFVANTHTESNATGTAMTQAYHEAKHILKNHVGASEDDALIFAGSGMTGAVTLLQRILGWKVPESFQTEIKLSEEDTPIVFVSELEHHSNHTSWIETIADVVVVPQTKTKTVDTQKLKELLMEYKNRRIKVAAMSAGSNVTGARTDVHEIAAIMHDAGGLCFVDYTCAAPYDPVDMHPANEASLDAVYFSPHKFLGGPGAPGVLVLDKNLYKSTAPDRPGGGTVLWTNPWGGRQYYDDIETREDGGTPPFLGAIRAALAVKLKEKMGTENIAKREEEIVNQVFSELGSTKKVQILAPNRKNRLAVFAFTIEGLHYNLVTRLLNDRFGVQARGGCACAGTYGHVLFGIDQEQSEAITEYINDGDFSTKPGFVRVSFSPTMANKTITYVTSAIKEIALYGDEWAKSYEYDPATNEFQNTELKQPINLSINEGFTL